MPTRVAGWCGGVAGGIQALLANVADPLVRGWMARLVANVINEAFLEWLDIGDPARDDEMVERVAYLLAGMVGSLWARAQARGERVGPVDQAP
jgi:hypothetical protein